MIDLDAVLQQAYLQGQVDYESALAQHATLAAHEEAAAAQQAMLEEAAVAELEAYVTGMAQMEQAALAEHIAAAAEADPATQSAAALDEAYQWGLQHAEAEHLMNIIEESARDWSEEHRTANEKGRSAYREARDKESPAPAAPSRSASRRKPA